MATNSENHLFHHEEELLDTSLYGASKELQEEVLSALAHHDSHHLHRIVESSHAADIADLILVLKPDDRYAFIQATKHVISPEVLSNLDLSVREEVFEILGLHAIAAAVTDLETDDALELIEELDAEQQKEILNAIPADERAILEEVLTYPEDSAGRMMQTEVVCVPPFWSTRQAIDFIRENPDISPNFYDIYVVDPKNHPIGKISLAVLLKQPLDKSVEEVMDHDIHLISVFRDREEVAMAFGHYNLVSAPVIDPSGRIVGMVTVDNIVEVINKEAEEDIMLMANVSESDFGENIWTTSYWRIRWLIVSLLSSLLSALVISHFQVSIQQVTALAFLMPIAASMGGSSGMQVVTVTVRALSNRFLREGNIFRSVMKEIYVGIIIGCFFAISTGLLTTFWVNSIPMGLILGAGLLLNILWGAFAGVIVPIILEKLDLDPAISAGPIIITTTDIFGFAIFLGLATLFLL
jgi:magnesium transporter